MIIEHNITAMNAKRNYGKNSKSLTKNLEKLSSGYKINRAGDDAAGLAISEKMRAQITGLDVAQKNAADGISLIQATEGALAEVHDMLNRLYELAEESANGVYGDAEREKLEMEVSHLKEEIDRVADSTNFNGIRPLAYVNDLTAALNKASIAKGDFNVSLVWHSADDLDLYCKTPGGHTLYYLTPDLAVDGGTMERDARPTAETYAIENMYFKDATDGSYSIMGGYSVSVTEHSDKQAGVPTEAILRLSIGDTRYDFGFEIDGSGTSMDLLTFEYKDGQLTYTEGAATLLRSMTGPSIRLMVGDTAAAYNFVDVPTYDMHAGAIGLGGLSVATQPASANAMDRILTAIDMVSDARAAYGAIQNRLEHTINNLAVMEENVQDAESVIRDTDVAEEMMTYTKNNILLQSAQAMMAQANQLPQGVLSLLQQ